MKPTQLITLCTAMACSIATAHPYQRWDNPATRTLQAEVELMQNADTPQKNTRIAVGDDTANQPYWRGEKPLPATRTADLLQLSLAAGSTGAEDWFTNAAGDVLVFVARPGVGAKHYVFTVFTRRDDEWHKTGTYHYISRHLRISWQETGLGHRGLTIVATSPGAGLRVEKHFDFAEKHDTFCAYDAPDEAADMGLDPQSPATPQHTVEGAPRFNRYSPYGYPRYDNEVTRTLEAEKALINGRVSPELGRRAFAAINPDNIACWTGTAALPAKRVADLLQQSMAHGHTVPDLWFTNASGSVIVFVALPGNGIGTDVYTVFRKIGSEYRRAGVYSFIRRSLLARPEEFELTDQHLTLTYTTPNNNTRFIKTFSLDTQEDTCRAFDDITELNDCGKDTRPNRYLGLPELAESPARERLQPRNEITRFLRLAEQEVYYHPDPLPSIEKESWRKHDAFTLLYLGMLRYGNVKDWISDPQSNTIAFISCSGVKHEVISTYTFRVYSCDKRAGQINYRLIGTYELRFSPYELRWDPAETFFRPNGLHVRCSDLGGTRHTGVIFHFSESKNKVQLN